MIKKICKENDYPEPQLWLMLPSFRDRSYEIMNHSIDGRYKLFRPVKIKQVLGIHDKLSVTVIEIANYVLIFDKLYQYAFHFIKSNLHYIFILLSICNY
jgi:hypothetical protein